MAKKSTRVQVDPAPATEPQPAAVEETAAQAAVQTESDDMGCAGCGQVPPESAPALTPEQIVTPERPNAEAVLLKFTGPYSAPVTFFEFYTGCKTCPPVWADPATAERLMNTGMWQRAEEQPA